MQGLVIGQDPGFTSSLSELIDAIGDHACHRHSDWSTADQIDYAHFDFVFCHVADEIEFALVFSLVTKIAKTKPPLPFIVIGQHIGLERKVRFLKAGALECLDRPINRQRIRYLIEAIGVKRKLIQLRDLHSEQTEVLSTKFLKQIRVLASIDANVMITGETGVGKTHVAKQIHRLSKRCDQPFVAINCAAIPENLIESELFGHAKGTFTGADTNRIGKFTFAKKGTILLDEIDALPLAAQAKLLHVVEEHVFQPLGCNQTQVVQARILAATNKPVDSLVQPGVFRSDLFHRLDVFELKIASLRERRSEILGFARLFVTELAKKYQRKVPRLSPDVENWMNTYEWPGNLRELKNCIEHAVLCCENRTIEMDDIPPRIRPDCSPKTAHTSNRIAECLETRIGKSKNRIDTRLEKKQQEIKRVIQALERNHFNRTRAAEAMGISRTAFYKKLHTLGLL